jgi:hypothetical protein
MPKLPDLIQPQTFGLSQALRAITLFCNKKHGELQKQVPELEHSEKM